MAATVKIDTRKLERALKVAPRVLAEHLKKASQRVGLRYRGFHRRQRMIGFTKSANPVPGKVRARKKFRDRFGVNVTGTRLSDLLLDMTVHSFVARRLQWGGVVHPRRGKYTAVPMPEARDQKGIVKKTARRYLGSGRLVVLRSGNKRFLALPVKGKKPRLFFHLQRSVTFEKRLGYIGRGGEWQRWLKKFGIRDWVYGANAAIRKALKAGGK